MTPEATTGQTTAVRLSDGACFLVEVKPDGQRVATAQLLDYVTLPHPKAPAWEEALRDRCEVLGITGDALTMVLLSLLCECDAHSIRSLMSGVTDAMGRPKYQRNTDVQRILRPALARIHADGFWRMCRDFEQTVFLALRGKVNHDARPPGVRGVTPNPASDQSCSPQFSSADVAQTRAQAARIYGMAHRQVHNPAAIAG